MAPSVRPDERTPLLGEQPQEHRKWGKSVLYRALLCGFMVSCSFGVTQVPLIYSFRLMTCEAYYRDHVILQALKPHKRCDLPEIEASTALSVALLSASTTIFGVLNLFITQWTIGKLGIKNALAIQVFWPAVRLAIQNVGIYVGSDTGILIIQCSQIITIIGGPSGYFLSLNSFVAEVVLARERTGALGRLQGSALFGTSIGYLAGGVISDKFNIAMPFKVTLAMFTLCSIYVILFLPAIPKQAADENKKKTASGIARFFGPLKIFVPQKWMLKDGTIKKQYGALILGIGVYLGITATGYIPVLLQMYSTDVLGFGPAENSYLVSLNSVLKGVFLVFIFPRLISTGRDWLERKHTTGHSTHGSSSDPGDAIPDIPTDAREFAASTRPIQEAQEPEEPLKPKTTEEQFDFDLLYTKYSLLADGILTGLATFVQQGWQIYVVAAILPFASGTGAAAKGTILQMCPAKARTEALSAITLVSMIAQLSTTTLFGMVFAGLAKAGKPELVFACNAAVALIGFAVLMFSRFPQEGSERWEEVEEGSSEEINR